MERVFKKIPIYWINLDRSTDRKISMEKELQNTNHTRISAIDGTDSELMSQYTITGVPNPAWTVPLLACTCSHLKAIKTAYDNYLSHVIILEDKCFFSFIDYINKSIDDVITETTTKNPDWNIIQLHSVPIPEPNFWSFRVYGLRAEKRVPGKSFGLNYLINRNGMSKILDKFKTTDTHFDFPAKYTSISNPEVLIYCAVNSYVLNFPLLYVYSDKSTFEYYLVQLEKLGRKKNVTPLHRKTKKLIEKYIKKNPVPIK